MYFTELKGEKPITCNGKRWLYVRDNETGKHLYLCLNCDCATDKDGYCILCGAPSPAAIKEK